MSNTEKELYNMINECKTNLNNFIDTYNNFIDRFKNDMINNYKTINRINIKNNVLSFILFILLLKLIIDKIKDIQKMKLIKFNYLIFSVYAIFIGLCIGCFIL